jgi:UDP-N-acetylglucosamine transferase subunit ALG13
LIFITVGSQKFQFNRLLQYIDDLVEKHIISDEIFAQTGFCSYQPKHYAFKEFLDREEFHKKISESDIIITHGGTGTIMGAVKAGKRVIAVPRLSSYGEHVDDHQEQIVNQFMESGMLPGVRRLEELAEAIKSCTAFTSVAYQSGTEFIIGSMEQYITEMLLDKNTFKKK